MPKTALASRRFVGQMLLYGVKVWHVSRARRTDLRALQLEDAFAVLQVGKSMSERVIVCMQATESHIA